jgi:hypothetical protein
MSAKETRDELASKMDRMDQIVDWTRERQLACGTSQFEIELKSNHARN